MNIHVYIYFFISEDGKGHSQPLPPDDEFENPKYLPPPPPPDDEHER